MNVWIVGIADPKFRDTYGVDKQVVHSMEEVRALAAIWPQLTIEEAAASSTIALGVRTVARVGSWSDAG